MYIAQERVHREWTQEYVAEKIGVSNQTVCDWENRRRYPSFLVLVKLEDLFEMDYRDLFNLPKRKIRDQTKGDK